jgi:hypothetical protein
LVRGRVVSASAGAYTISGRDAALTYTPAGGLAPTFTNEVNLTPRIYLKRGKKFLIFNTTDEADAWESAEKQAIAAVEKAQKTSRRARKRLKEKVYKALEIEPLDTVDVDLLERLATVFEVRADFGRLVAMQNISQLMQIRDRLSLLQDEEDLEILLAMS